MWTEKDNFRRALLDFAESTLNGGILTIDDIWEDDPLIAEIKEDLWAKKITIVFDGDKVAGYDINFVPKRNRL